MKSVIGAILCAGGLTAGASSVVIADFENGKVDGVQIYCDQESGKPSRPEINNDEVLSGNYALKVTFNGCRKYQGVHFHKAPALPEKSIAISFLIKPVYGPPPTGLVLGEVNKRYSKAVISGYAPLNLNGNDWQKVTIRLDSMKFNSGPKRNAKFIFKTGALYVFTLYGMVTAQPSVFLLDDIKWETL